MPLSQHSFGHISSWVEVHNPGSLMLHDKELKWKDGVLKELSGTVSLNFKHH